MEHGQKSRTTKQTQIHSVNFSGGEIVGEKDVLRIVVCSIIACALVVAGIKTQPFSFPLTVAGIFLIIYGFSPSKAKDIIRELGEITRKLIHALFGK